jgi:hypothetical protein
MMQELREVHERLYSRQLMHGYWDNISEFTGSLPDARECTSASVIDSQVFIFGGFSREIYNDLRIFSLETKSWRYVN